MPSRGDVWDALVEQGETNHFSLLPPSPPLLSCSLSQSHVHLREGGRSFSVNVESHQFTSTGFVLFFILTLGY